MSFDRWCRVNVSEAFGEFQGVVNADIGQVREARGRRDLFRDAFETDEDVVEVVASGSLARGTQKDPVHDVDLILVYSETAHPDWGLPGQSAELALDHVRARVNVLLGGTHGTYAQVVRLARWRNHAVKCFLDDPDDPDAFTVDVMPALRRDGQLFIPEATSRQWVRCDPESLIEAVAAKHRDWGKFAGTVRMLKWWAGEQDIKIKSLVMEVLSLDCLPTTSTQSQAVKQFFVNAAYRIEGGDEVDDPARICGPIQADLDYAELGARLRASADTAGRAVQAQLNNDNAGAVRAWREVFGDAFPAPPAGGSGGVPAAVPLEPRPVKDTPQG